MNITLCSAFRNASRYVNDYIRRISDLELELYKRGDTLSLVWGEGDSTDDTLYPLKLCRSTAHFKCIIVDCTHNGPTFESIEHPQRFRQLAYVGNKILAAIPDDADVVLWVESDLVWKPETLIALIDRLQTVPCVAPMIMEKSSGGFYDVWAGRIHGQRFTKSYPYFIGYKPNELVQVDSMGSCMAIRADLARQLTWPEEDVFVGLCRNVYALGHSVFLDTGLTVWHP